MAQNSSGCSRALAVTISPPAVTTSAPASWSRARPYFLTFQPMPPLSVSPPTPTPLGVAGGDGQAVRGQGGRDLTPGGAALDPHQAAILVDDLHRGQRAEIDHHATVIGAEAREAMAPAAHGQLEPGLGREPHRGLHVPGTGGPQHHGRIAPGQERTTDRSVPRRVRFDDLAAEVTPEDFRG
jgi:hypothetical protein